MSLVLDEADFAVLRDFAAACAASGVRACLIGAGAIRFGGDGRWRVGTERSTLDWDFAVRLESWSSVDAFMEALTTNGGCFARTQVAHRLRHRNGKLLDVVPYGGLENPPGSVSWPDGSSLDTRGLIALEENQVEQTVGELRLWTPSVPALIGLKLLAYGSRRPGVVRDIQDVDSMLKVVGQMELRAAEVEECLPRFGSQELSFSDAPIYILGRHVAQAFPRELCDEMVRLLQAGDRPGEVALADLLRSSPYALTNDRSAGERLQALAFGVQDGPATASGKLPPRA